MSDWNGLDFFIFLIFTVCTIRGMARGAAKEIISTMCLSIALIFTIKFTVPLTKFMLRSPLIQDVLDSPFLQSFMTAIGAQPLSSNFLTELSYSLSLLICFVGTFSFCEAALHYTGFVEVFTFPYAAISRKLGGALGATRGYVFSLILIVVFSLHLFKSYGDDDINNVMQGSIFIGLFRDAAIKLDGIIGRQEVDKYQEIYKGKDTFNDTNVTNILNPQTNDQTNTNSTAQPNTTSQ